MSIHQSLLSFEKTGIPYPLLITQSSDNKKLYRFRGETPQQAHQKAVQFSMQTDCTYQAIATVECLTIKNEDFYAVAVELHNTTTNQILVFAQKIDLDTLDHIDAPILIEANPALPAENQTLSFKAASPSKR